MNRKNLALTAAMTVYCCYFDDCCHVTNYSNEFWVTSLASAFCRPSLADWNGTGAPGAFHSPLWKICPRGRGDFLLSWLVFCHSLNLSESSNFNIAYNFRTVKTISHEYTYMYIVVRPVRGKQDFWHCDLDLGVWPLFKKPSYLAITFDQ